MRIIMSSTICKVLTATSMRFSFLVFLSDYLMCSHSTHCWHNDRPHFIFHISIAAIGKSYSVNSEQWAHVKPTTTIKTLTPNTESYFGNRITFISNGTHLNCQPFFEFRRQNLTERENISSQEELMPIRKCKLSFSLCTQDFEEENANWQEREIIQY